MARCCGSTGSCACKMVAGRNVEVTGTGTAQDPFVIASRTALNTADSEQFTLILTGEGTLESPWNLRVDYGPAARLDNVPDVDAAAPVNGEVLSWSDSAQAWVPSAPAIVDTGVLGSNPVPNPSFETGVDGWSALSGSDAPTVDDSWAHSGSQSMRVARGAGTSDLWSSGNIGGQVEPNKTYTLSAYLLVPSTNTTDARLRVSGADVVALVDSFTAVRDQEVRVSATFTTNDTADAVFAYVGGGADGYLNIDSIKIDEGDTALPYGDGDSPGWEWLGTPHASASRSVVGVLTGDGIGGDGSSGAPLAVTPDDARYIQVTADGVGLTDEAINRMVRPFPDATVRDAADPPPEVGTLSMLYTDPGRIDYWTGADWLPIDNGIRLDVQPGELLTLSGAYDGGTVMQRIQQMSAETDVAGDFEVLSELDLTNYAGVLSVHVQELGEAGWKGVVRADEANGRIMCRAFRLDDGTAYAGYTLESVVTAWLY